MVHFAWKELLIYKASVHIPENTLLFLWDGWDEAVVSRAILRICLLAINMTRKLMMSNKRYGNATFRIKANKLSHNGVPSQVTPQSKLLLENSTFPKMAKRLVKNVAWNHEKAIMRAIVREVTRLKYLRGSLTAICLSIANITNVTVEEM